MSYLGIVCGGGGGNFFFRKTNLSFHIFFVFYAISNIFRKQIFPGGGVSEPVGDRVALFGSGSVNINVFLNPICVWFCKFGNP